MVMFFYIFLCFHVVVGATSALQPGMSSIFATENALRANKIVSSNLMGTAKSESVRKCAFLCLQNVRCMAYLYRQNSSECRLMKLDITEDSAWRIDQGWRYYNVYDCKLN